MQWLRILVSRKVQNCLSFISVICMVLGFFTYILPDLLGYKTLVSQSVFTLFNLICMCSIMTILSFLVIAKIMDEDNTPSP